MENTPPAIQIKGMRDSLLVSLSDAPWTLAPAAAIFLTVLAVNLLLEQRRAPRESGQDAPRPGLAL